ncbi:Uncharacterized protein PBTT_00486 [Plasmodiophora brassicae]|uniref:Uncharacterized protein n=1 Tax=Plasmodiophora brassicae TaxID=37360 RepID=A0A0G4ILZ6_PLABS|nr:hypothetical protein PBRA_004810 [Plasmodiophora brassicae]
MTTGVDYRSQILSVLDDLKLDYSTGVITSDRITFVITNLAIEQKVVIEWTDRCLLLIRNVALFLLPEMARLPVAEMLVRNNWALSTGNFELDFSDGEIRFKASAFYYDMADIKPIFTHHMKACLESFQDVVPKLRALA